MTLHRLTRDEYMSPAWAVVEGWAEADVPRIGLPVARYTNISSGVTVLCTPAWAAVLVDCTTWCGLLPCVPDGALAHLHAALQAAHALGGDRAVHALVLSLLPPALARIATEAA